MTSQRRILVMAGGTGGHVFPALAIAAELKQRGCVIEWLGTAAGIEKDLVPAADIPLNQIRIKGLRGKGRLGLLLAPLKIIRATMEAISVIRRFRPDAVIGLGGYVTGPGGLAAYLTRIPLLVHEQNAKAGMTNRLLQRISRVAMQAFPGALPAAEVVGNPVRPDILNNERQQRSQPKPLRVLVVGGSLGAVALNQQVLDAMTACPAEFRPQLTHQAGKNNFAELQQAYQTRQIAADVRPFIDDMAAAYNDADLIICRSGALTVSEVAASGCPAIFVPFPYAVDDHQTANAQFLVDAKAALICQQADLSTDWLVEQWQTLTEQPERLVDMSMRAKEIAVSDATERVVARIEEVIGNG